MSSADERSPPNKSGSDATTGLFAGIVCTAAALIVMFVLVLVLTPSPVRDAIVSQLPDTLASPVRDVGKAGRAESSTVAETTSDNKDPIPPRTGESQETGTTTVNEAATNEAATNEAATASDKAASSAAALTGAGLVGAAGTAALVPHSMQDVPLPQSRPQISAIGQPENSRLSQEPAVAPQSEKAGTQNAERPKNTEQSRYKRRRPRHHTANLPPTLRQILSLPGVALRRGFRF